MHSIDCKISSLLAKLRLAKLVYKTLRTIPYNALLLSAPIIDKTYIKKIMFIGEHAGNMSLIEDPILIDKIYNEISELIPNIDCFIKDNTIQIKEYSGYYLDTSKDALNYYIEMALLLDAMMFITNITWTKEDKPTEILSRMLNDKELAIAESIIIRQNILDLSDDLRIFDIIENNAIDICSCGNK